MAVARAVRAGLMGTGAASTRCVRLLRCPTSRSRASSRALVGYRAHDALPDGPDAAAALPEHGASRHAHADRRLGQRPARAALAEPLEDRLTRGRTSAVRPAGRFDRNFRACSWRSAGAAWRAAARALLLAAELARGGAAAGARRASARGSRPGPRCGVLVDASGTLDLARACWRHASASTCRRTAYATLGLSRDASGCRMPLSVPAGGDGPWILDIDYALLNRVDVLPGARRASGAAGAAGQPAAVRRAPARQPHRMRCRCSCSPARALRAAAARADAGRADPADQLRTLSAFHARALDEQMLQGLLDRARAVPAALQPDRSGGACASTLYLKYALLTSGSLLFSVAQFGIGAQYLWTDHAVGRAQDGRA